MSSASVIIPAFNEGPAIGEVLARLKTLPLTLELVVVDDGSTDDTGAVAKAHGAKVIRHPINVGYGHSLKDGIRAAENDIIILTDADGSYPIDQIPALVARLEEGLDMVTGARQGKEYLGSVFKRPLRAMLLFLAEWSTGCNIPDVNSGMRVFRKSQITPFLAGLCSGFSFTTTLTLTYHLTGKMVDYMPIPYNKRVGKSHVKMLRDSLRTLQYMTEVIVRYNPIKLFLLLAIVTLFIAGFFAWLFNVPSITVFGFFTSATIFALGLTAEALRPKP